MVRILFQLFREQIDFVNFATYIHLFEKPADVDACVCICSLDSRRHEYLPYLAPKDDVVKKEVTTMEINIYLFILALSLVPLFSEAWDGWVFTSEEPNVTTHVSNRPEVVS